jgi:hypothetical protein
MNDMTIEPGELFRIIGEQVIKLGLLEKQLAKSQQATIEAMMEASKMRARLADFEDAPMAKEIDSCDAMQAVS